MNELTRQQQAVYDFVKSYIEEKSYPPTIREIGAAVGLSSTSTVHSHVKTLIDKGYLVSSPSTQRTIALAMPENKQRHVMDVPCVGTVAAGTPILAFDDVTESLPLPTSLLHGAKKGEAFILEVKGESMIEAGINSGLGAENGDIVVARVCGDTATVKRIFYENPKIRLQPENSGMEPIYADYDNVEVLGRVVALLRRY